MSLVRYHIRYDSLSPEERRELINQIESVAFTGFAVAADFCSGEFFLDSDDDLRFIKIPDGCILTKM